jgi:O-antigen/teichoic acid export membrane protein
LVKAPLIYFAAASSFDFFVAGISFLIAYKVIGFRISEWKFKKEIAFSVLKDSWPLMLSVLAITIYMKIDQVIIRNMLDEKQVGYYAAAVRLTEAWYFIPAAIVTSLFPAILNAKQADERIYMNRLQKLYDLLVLIAVGIALPVTIFSKEIVVILLGSDYINSAAVLTIYIWGSVAVFLGIASNQYLVTENFTHISFYRTLAGVIINIILNLMLIPIIGILGSALATLFSYTLSVLSISLNKKTSAQFIMMLKAIFMVNILKFAYKKVLR